MFILGFKNPSLLPALLGPSSLPSLFCALQPSPAGSALLLSSSPSPASLSIPPLRPSLPSLLERGRGGGSGRRFVRLAALRSPGDRPAPPALPPPPPQATSAVGGRTRVPESSRELLAYKQEAPNHGHTGFFSRLYSALGRDRRIDCSWGTQVAPVFIAVPQPPPCPRPQSWEVHLATPRLE